MEEVGLIEGREKGKEGGREGGRESGRERGREEEKRKGVRAHTVYKYSDSLPVEQSCCWRSTDQCQRSAAISVKLGIC